jgi:hypothetical protein
MILVKKIRILVEKFESMIKKQEMPILNKILKKETQVYASGSACLEEKSFARLVIRHNFTISEGIKEIGPRFTQRFAPPVVAPKT